MCPQVCVQSKSADNLDNPGSSWQPTFQLFSLRQLIRVANASWFPSSYRELEHKALQGATWQVVSNALILYESYSIVAALNISSQCTRS